jgi:small subunit ribosomal protein S16
MSLVIRLTTIGRKGERRFRLVVKEKRSKRDGKSVEELGWFEKTEKGQRMVLKKDRIAHWIARGALPSPTVKKLIEAA